jgi:regulator of protease activity HflC (stomatin/prohibitin superfamily)
LADTQARVVDAERSVSISEFAAQAMVKKANGEAQSKTINAEADATVITTVGNAEAEKTKAVGTAEADVIKLKINSMESRNYAAVQIANALATNHIKLVPDIIAGGGGEQGGLINLLLAKMLQGTVMNDGTTEENKQ